MLTLDSKIVIGGVETTPGEWVADNTGYWADKHGSVYYQFEYIHEVFDSYEEAQNSLLGLFHDHINNKGITYEII